MPLGGSAPAQRYSGKEKLAMRKKNRLGTILLFILLAAGLSLLLYPTFSDHWNALHQSRAISDYAEHVADMDSELYEKTLESALEYNRTLPDKQLGFAPDDEQLAEYNAELDISGQGIMGYVEIPSIGVSLPIYHGTDETVLQIAVGHIEWSSLPVGGESSHCVLSGHRALPSAKLFTDLDDLVEGDIFILRVLNEVYTYEVDRILIVEPDETSALEIIEGEELCTLMTCTPYAVNTHRLLVRGHRIENIEQSERIRATADAVQVEPMIIASVIGVPMFLVMLAVMLSPRRAANKERRQK